MNIILRYFLHLTAIIIVCALMVSYSQPQYVSDILKNHYDSCMSENLQIQNITLTDTINCIRNGHGKITVHYDQQIRPILYETLFSWLLMLINDVCVMFKNYLLLIVPVTMLGMYRTRISKISPLFTDSLILCAGWNYLYRYVIASILRNCTRSNISGHIIILPLILSWVIVSFVWYLTYSDLKDRSTSRWFRRPDCWIKVAVSTVIIFLSIHIMFTCLFFHTFYDVLLGGVISYIIGYVLNMIH